MVKWIYFWWMLPSFVSRHDQKDCLLIKPWLVVLFNHPWQWGWSCFLSLLISPGDSEKDPWHCQHARLVQHSDEANWEAGLPGQVLHDRWDAAHMCSHVPCGTVPDMSQLHPAPDSLPTVCACASKKWAGRPPSEMYALTVKTPLPQD